MTAPGENAHLFDKIESLEEQATLDILNGDYGPPPDRLPELSRRSGRAIPSSARMAAWHLINTENKTVTETKLFGLVDAAACVLAHERNGHETARLAFEAVVAPSVALAAVRILTGEDR